MKTYPHFTPHFRRGDWTLPAILRHQAKTRPDAPFLSWTDEGQPISFREMEELTNRLANGLRQFELGKGDRVVLFLPNCPEFIPLWFAISKLGAVEAPIAESAKGGFLAHQLKVAAPKLIVTTPALSHALADMGESIACENVLVVNDDGDNASIADLAVRVSCFKDLRTDDPAHPDVDVAPRDLGAILFTSGTTGPSKGVLMTHSQLCFFAEEGAQLTGLTSEDVYMTSFPLIHGNAQVLTVFPSLIAGAHCVVYPRFSASDWIGRVKRSGATVTNTIGATMSFICAQPPSGNDRDHALRRVYAAPLSPDLEPVFVERFGVDHFVNGFGQTEISLPFMTPPGSKAPPHAMGKLVDQWFEVKLADPETGEEVEEGAVGELLIRPRVPNIICSGYAQMPEKTVEAMRDLWFHTGDAMRRDADGWYYFADRVKDALRRRGENISSFEVEAVIRSFPAVSECAVIGVPADEAGGENEVMAFVVVAPGAAFVCEDLIAWCDARMPYFMVPRYVEVIDALPQTPSEKVQKGVLRERGVTSRTWDRVRANCLLERERAKRTA